MDALSSVSPYSSQPESRKNARLRDVPVFSMDGGRASAGSEPGANRAPNLFHAHSPLAEACHLTSGPASDTSLSRSHELLVAYPYIAKTPSFSRDEREAPQQAFPAIALAAIQGQDPEGWVLRLLHWGVSFDTRAASAQAREELFGMGLNRGGSLTVLSARCDALSLWTLACAEASHPHSALRAIESARRENPTALPTLFEEIERFGDDPRLDKPTLDSKARAGSFIEAARGLDDFFDTILPSWILGSRGEDVAAIARPIAMALGVEDAAALSSSLSLASNNPHARTVLLTIFDAMNQRRPKAHGELRLAKTRPTGPLAELLVDRDRQLESHDSFH